MASEREFLDAIRESPDDLHLRKVYADWLDEQDRPEEAQVQRGWTAEHAKAEAWLRAFASVYGTTYESMMDGLARSHVSFGDDDGPHEAQNSRVFWACAALVTGKAFTDEEQGKVYFSCSC